mmetsp:Transcript_4169/g.9016  ORF Transcript_4169/g.9016 Transcript_4169/m.9016 type:complete len:388 (+) Transcript_4169:586-1749(+)
MPPVIDLCDSPSPTETRPERSRKRQRGDARENGAELSPTPNVRQRGSGDVRDGTRTGRNRPSTSGGTGPLRAAGATGTTSSTSAALPTAAAVASPRRARGEYAAERAAAARAAANRPSSSHAATAADAESRAREEADARLAQQLQQEEQALAMPHFLSQEMIDRGFPPPPSMPPSHGAHRPFPRFPWQSSPPQHAHGHAHHGLASGGYNSLTHAIPAAVLQAMAPGLLNPFELAELSSSPIFGMHEPPHARFMARDQLAHLSLMNRDFGEADYEMLLQLDEAAGPDKRALQANARLIEQLPTRKLTRAEGRAEQSCVICLENMRSQQTALKLPCKHDFHKSCIVKWLKSHVSPTCPICKAAALDKPDPTTPAPTTTPTSTAEEWHHT